MKITFSMDNRTVFYKLGMVMALAVAFQACKPKINEIDNNQVISKPYSLYIGLESGGIWSTNDGYHFRKDVFGIDGVPVSGMVVSGENLVYLKNRYFTIETNKGPNANPTQIAPNPNVYYLGMFLDWPKYKRLYCAASQITGASPLSFSDSNGNPRAFWRPDLTGAGSINSLTMLASGRALAFDLGSKTVYRCDDPVSSTWQQVSPSSSLPADKYFFISHIANTALAITDTGDIYYSNNDGATWDKYNGIPGGTRNLCACAPFDQTILVGTDGKGIYRLPLGKKDFVSSSVGLPTNAKVRCIVAKYDYYKNDQRRNYVYAATDQGLFRSNNNGENWVKLLDEPCVSLY